MKKISSILGLIAVLALITIFILAAALIIHNPYQNYNDMLHGNIYNLSDTEEFVFNDIVPFDWDKVYTFEPGTTKAEIEKILGFKNGKIKDIPQNSQPHIIFVKDNQITAYPNVNNTQINYNINLMKKDNEKYAVLESHHYAVFYVENIRGTIELYDMEIFTTEEGMNEYVNKKS